MYENCVIWHVRRHARNGARAPFYTVELERSSERFTLAAVLRDSTNGNGFSVELEHCGMYHATAQAAQRAMLAARAAYRKNAGISHIHGFANVHRLPECIVSNVEHMRIMRRDGMSDATTLIFVDSYMKN